MQDVRKLQFADGFFDGYWSLGVIEYFWEGYNEIVNEVKRVIKPGMFSVLINLSILHEIAWLPLRFTLDYDSE